MGTVKVIRGAMIDDKLVGAALKLCTTEGKALNLLDEISVDDATKLRGKVWGSPHTSPFEFIDFRLVLDDVSMVAELFLINYRFASFAIKSRRYVDFANQGCYKVEIDNLPDEFKIYADNHIQYLFKAYKEAVAAEYPKEIARYILPLALHSNIYCKVNILELMRMCRDMYMSGTPELRAIAVSILDQIRVIYPELLKGTYYNDDILTGSKKTLDEAKIVTIAKNHISKENGAYRAIELQNMGYDPEKHVMPITTMDITLNTGILGTVVKYTDSVVIGLKRAIAILLNIDEETNIEEVIRDNTIKEIFKTDNRLLELLDNNYMCNFYRIKLSYSALTHLLRHRVQTVLVQPNSISGGTYLGHHLEKDPYFKPILATHAEFIATARSYNIPNEIMQYYHLCGDYTLAIQKDNLRERLHMAHLRLCNRAQEEIRSIVQVLVDDVGIEKFIPFDPLDDGDISIEDTIKKSFNATCVSGVCKEGKFGCGNPKG